MQINEIVMWRPT